MFVRSDDRIVITEVRGTRPDFAVGGVYLVRGEYTLASVDSGAVGLFVAATRPGEGCTEGNQRGYAQVMRGSGKFELATRIVYPGYLHVSLYDGYGHGLGEMYFGKAAFLHK